MRESDGNFVPDDLLLGCRDALREALQPLLVFPSCHTVT